MMKVIATLVLIAWALFTVSAWIESSKRKYTNFCDMRPYWRLLFSLSLGALLAAPWGLALLALWALIATIFDVPFR